MSCPDLRVLSQLLDGELPPAVTAAVRAHVDACTACPPRLGRLERALVGVRAAASSPRADAFPADPLPGCLAPEVVARWVTRTLPAREARGAETHLEGCTRCLDEVLAAAHMMAVMDALPSRPVPATLKARVASRWGDAAEPSPAGLVLRLTRAGLALVERHVVAPLLDIELLAGPAPAVRAGAGVDTLSFHIRAAEAEIQATVVPAGETVALTLTLLRDSTPLVGQRVSLRKHARAIYSARTDAAGEVRPPRLDPGVYEVSCPGIHTAFRLDLRA